MMEVLKVVLFVLELKFLLIVFKHGLLAEHLNRMADLLQTSFLFC